MGEPEHSFRIRIEFNSKTYALLQKETVKEGGDEGAAVKIAIERGMERYWTHWFDELAASYELLKKTI